MENLSKMFGSYNYQINQRNRQNMNYEFVKTLAKKLLPTNQALVLDGVQRQRFIKK